MKLQRKIKPKPMVPMASMSDIAFLLIIFFMVSTTFMKESGIEAKPPKTRVGEELKKKVLATLTIDENGETYLDGTRLPISGIPERLEGRFGDRKLEDRIIVLKCDRDVQSALYVPVIEKISEVGGALEIWVEPAAPQ
jgi:biopolymer transport protein ExbD